MQSLGFETSHGLEPKAGRGLSTEYKDSQPGAGTRSRSSEAAPRIFAFGLAPVTATSTLSRECGNGTDEKTIWGIGALDGSILALRIAVHLADASSRSSCVQLSSADGEALEESLTERSASSLTMILAKRTGSSQRESDEPWRPHSAHIQILSVHDIEIEGSESGRPGLVRRLVSVMLSVDRPRIGPVEAMELAAVPVLRTGPSSLLSPSRACLRCRTIALEASPPVSSS